MRLSSSYAASSSIPNTYGSTTAQQHESFDTVYDVGQESEGPPRYFGRDDKIEPGTKLIYVLQRKSAVEEKFERNFRVSCEMRENFGIRPGFDETRRKWHRNAGKYGKISVLRFSELGVGFRFSNRFWGFRVFQANFDFENGFRARFQILSKGFQSPISNFEQGFSGSIFANVVPKSSKFDEKQF